MTIELLIAVGFPIADLVISKALLLGSYRQWARVLERLTACDALFWMSLRHWRSTISAG